MSFYAFVSFITFSAVSPLCYLRHLDCNYWINQWLYW